MAIKSPLHESYSVTELGAVFGIATNSLKDKINKAGVAPSDVSKDGIRKRYKISDVYQGLISLIEEERDSAGLSEPQSHRERLDKLKADEVELKNRVLRAELVDRNEVIREFSTALTTIKNRLLVLPKKFGIRSIEVLDALKFEAEIELEIRTILEELSNYDTTADSGNGDDTPKATTETND